MFAVDVFESQCRSRDQGFRDQNFGRARIDLKGGQIRHRQA
jgi:hypothetical protein